MVFYVSSVQLKHCLILCLFLLSKSLFQMCGNTEIPYLAPWCTSRIDICICFMRAVIPVEIHAENHLNQNMNIYHSVIIIVTITLVS